MKFTIVAVIALAFALGAQSSVLPLGFDFGLGSRLNIAGRGISYTALSGPAIIRDDIPVGPWPFGFAPHAIAAEGTYIAQTPGATHVAPLPGHLESVSSLNTGSAPGTW